MMTSLAIAAAVLAILFAALWAVCVRVRNYGFLDAAWSYGVALVAPIYAVLGIGAAGRKVAVCGVGVLWSLRLGTYILRRLLRQHPEEDVRYEALRRRWPGAWMFLVFFELQALTVLILSVPFLLAAWNPVEALSVVEITGPGIAAGAIVGEATADRQLQRFKAEKRGSVCEVGLWRYSRHPNYFFEFVFWVGIFVASLGTPWGWITIVCPALMLYFLMKVTGIPLTEEYALKSKGEAYRRYQQTTSAFVPWFRRN